MKERPIIMRADDVRAILAGTKTQTRRIAKLSSAGRVERGGRNWHVDDPDAAFACPYGQPGDRLWVRESLRFVRVGENYHEHAVYAADGVRVPRCPDLLPQFCDGMAFGLARSVPSIHMPSWASRITLEITGVRVERLQDISKEDVIAEGVNRIAHGREGYFYHATRTEPHPKNWCYPDDAYRDLWEQINGPGSWDANPFVWVVEFRRAK